MEEGEENRFILAAATGIGPGPSLTGVLQAGLGVRVPDGISLHAELGTWHSGVGVSCQQSIPESNLCTVRGTSLLASFRFNPIRRESLSPYMALSGGLFVRDGVPLDSHFGLGLGLEGGGRIRVSDRFFARAGVRFVHVHDAAYKELMGERLRFVTGLVAIEFEPG